ncbi:MAG: DUF6883 domain-containing protein [Acidobacteriota bacterium]
MPELLPNAECAFIDLAKLRDYCLNPDREVGQNKARVFQSALGLTMDDAERLKQLLLAAVLTTPAQRMPHNEYGQRFVVDIKMLGRRGEVVVRSAWIVLDHEDFPRLTSCYVK